MEKVQIVYLFSHRGIYDTAINKLHLMKGIQEKYEYNCIYYDEIAGRFYRDKERRGILYRVYNMIRLFFEFNYYFERNYSFDNSRDILSIQYVSFMYILLFPYMKRNFRKVILSYWGSDLYRQKNWKLKCLFPLLKLSDKITFETDEVKKDFIKVFGNKYDNKIEIVRFGNSVLEDIDDIKEKEVEAFTKKYNINNRKKIVVIGYSRIPEHQHIAVVESIIRACIDSENIILLFPWTYGICRQGYKQEIIDILNDQYEYTFLEKRLTEREIACLRYITDIMVQVQTTDSLSFSMLETLYARRKVVTGRWLPYKWLYEKGVYMHSVNKVSEVGEKIQDALCESADNKFEKNREIVGKLLKWENVVEQWVALYE